MPIEVRDSFRKKTMTKKINKYYIHIIFGTACIKSL